MPTTVHAFSRLERPGLYVWRSGAPGTVLVPTADDRASGWSEFRVVLDPRLRGAVFFKLVGLGPTGSGADWEADAFNREMKRVEGEGGDFPAEVWVFHGARRVLAYDPDAVPPGERVRVRLVTLNRYRESQLYLWDSEGRSVRLEPSGAPDHLGPVFDVDLGGARTRFFYFKFARGERDADGNRTDFEPDVANRVYAAGDGGEIWVHSDADIVRRSRPVLRQLTLHLHAESHGPETPLVHLWQPGSGFEQDLAAEPEGEGWTTHRALLYTDIGYGMKVRYRGEGGDWWEPDRATRHLTLAGEAERWAIEGDDALFTSRPERDVPVTVRIAARPDGESFRGPLRASVGLRDARGWSRQDLALAEGDRLEFAAYPGVRMKLAYFQPGATEAISTHRFDVPADGTPLDGFTVLSRPAVLLEAPPALLFEDPPFRIARPGVREVDGQIHFALHAPSASRARLLGDWTGAPVEMSLANDGAFFWATVPVAELLGAGRDDYHGARYNYLLDDDWSVHDPAAQWVEGSGPGFHSLLFNPRRHAWRSDSWRRPGWEYLIVYQLHPARFSDRHSELSPLLQVAHEIDEQAGYLRDLGVTAIQLMPVNEVGSPVYGWGYDPAFFYAVEHNYGGPADLQELVDTCHANGLAVILDVVFNHTGNSDNILYATARDTFLDGDTGWGPLINFDNDLCRFFFAENVRYLAETFRIDGFRFDHTDTIINGHFRGPFVTSPGSGGGWEFLSRLRGVLAEVDPSCIMIAEELPNDWYLTNHGPMDSQWCDEFHDRLVDLCRRRSDVRGLARALETTHLHCQEWYHATNYAESHDEVGNEDNRIARCAEFGSGLRLAKVALAAVLLGRGIPLLFMGGEAGESRQFARDRLDALPLARYREDPNHRQVLAWFRTLCGVRRADERIKGPAPLAVRHADGGLLAFSRGGGAEIFVVLNFGGWSGWKSLASLDLPDGAYRELWNSTWPAFAVPGEWEDEHRNGGRDARLGRGDWLDIPDFGALVLERT